jgi:acyl-CoA thioesterase I
MRVRGLVLAVAVVAAACGAPDGSHRAGPPESRAVPPFPRRPGENAKLSAPATPTTGTGPRIVILGDSLTAGLGLPVTQSYPALLQQRLKDEGSDYQIVNAGVSGDTSAGGLSRLDWALDGDVRVMVVALGGNDGLRGLPPEQLQANLAAIIKRAQARGISVILAGMEAPPNYGREYIVAFHQVYQALAKEYHVALVPFLLDGVAGKDALNQSDGIHPSAAGAQVVADNVWKVLKPVVTTSR